MAQVFYSKAFKDISLLIKLPGHTKKKVQTQTEVGLDTKNSLFHLIPLL